jgi:Tol biopolymer transport system component/predicted Ser/Thr protein kinase
VNDDDRADPSAVTVPGKAPAEVDPFEKLLREVATAPAPPPSPWETLEEKRYRILALLGGGGGGQVYKAFDEQLGREVALKFLNSIGPAHTAQLVQEARTQARVKHPGICQVYEVVESVGRPFIAMQLIEGPTLGAAELSLAEKVTIMRLVAEAVDAAHQLGIVHRDLKPANVILERAPDGGWRPYVTDFGLARELDKTLTQGMAGTPNFMAPEQARGDVGAIGPLTDVWALGATLYQLLAGKPPFDGDSIMSILRSVELDEPARLPSVPPELEAIVFRCLEKLPRNRYPSAAALARDLAAFERGEPVVARRRSLLRRAQLTARKNRWRILGAGALVVAASGYVALRPVRAWQPHVVELLPRYDESNGKMQVSPDGKQLLFSARRGGDTRLYLQASTGGATRPIEGTDERSAAHWSSSGDSIYMLHEDSGVPYIERMQLRPRAAPVRVMTGSEAVECGGRLFFERVVANHDVQLLTLEAGGEERMLLSASEGLWDLSCSRDGKRVAYVRASKERIGWLGIDDGIEHLLPALGDANHSPSFHPDGRSLLLVAFRGDESTLWEQRLDGSRARQLTTSGREHSPQLTWDRQLFFETGQSARSLTVRSLEDGTTRNVGPAAFWSSLSLTNDGRILTSRIGAGKHREVVTVDVANDSEKVIAAGWLAVLSPDGRSLYFAAEDSRSLWTMSFPDGRPALLARLPEEVEVVFAGSDALHIELGNDRAWRQPYDGSVGTYEGPSGAACLLPAADGWTVACGPTDHVVILRPGPWPEKLPDETRYHDLHLTADRRAFVALDEQNRICLVEIATGKERVLANGRDVMYAELASDGKTLYTLEISRRTARAVITNYADLPPL